jgi:hypothetical protein
MRWLRIADTQVAWLPTAGDAFYLRLLKAVLWFLMQGEVILNAVISPAAGGVSGNARPVTLAVYVAIFPRWFALTPLIFVSKIRP